MTSIDEKLARVKRKHTDLYPAVFINPTSVLRNKIVKYIGGHDKFRVPVEEFKEFCNKLEEDEQIGKKPSKSWIHRNKHLIKKIRVGEKKFYKLTKIGQRVYNHLAEEDKKKQNEGESEANSLFLNQLLSDYQTKYPKEVATKIESYLKNNDLFDGGKFVLRSLDVSVYKIRKDIEDIITSAGLSIDAFEKKLLEFVIDLNAAGVKIFENFIQFKQPYRDQIKKVFEDEKKKNPDRVGGILFHPPTFDPETGGTGGSAQAPAQSGPANSSETEPLNDGDKVELSNAYTKEKGYYGLIKNSNDDKSKYYLEIYKNDKLWYTNWFPAEVIKKWSDDSVFEYVRKRGNKWVVLSKKGKVLGRHDTKGEANDQLAAIEANKHKH